jgi:hypothetical protein
MRRERLIRCDVTGALGKELNRDHRTWQGEGSGKDKIERSGRLRKGKIRMTARLFDGASRHGGKTNTHMMCSKGMGRRIASHTSLVSADALATSVRRARRDTCQRIIIGWLSPPLMKCRKQAREHAACCLAARGPLRILKLCPIILIFGQTGVPSEFHVFVSSKYLVHDVTLKVAPN